MKCERLGLANDSGAVSAALTLGKHVQMESHPAQSGCENFERGQEREAQKAELSARSGAARPKTRLVKNVTARLHTPHRTYS